MSQLEVLNLDKDKALANFESWTDDQLDELVCAHFVRVHQWTFEMAMAMTVRKQRGTWRTEETPTWAAFVQLRYGVTRMTAWRRLEQVKAALEAPDKPPPSQVAAIRRRASRVDTKPQPAIEASSTVREPVDTQAGEVQPPPGAAAVEAAGGAATDGGAGDGRGISPSPSGSTSPRGTSVPAPEPSARMKALEAEIINVNAENAQLRKDVEVWRMRADGRAKLTGGERDARLVNVLLDAAEHNLEGELIAEMYGDRDLKRQVNKWLKRFAKRFDNACTPPETKDTVTMRPKASWKP